MDRLILHKLIKSNISSEKMIEYTRAKSNFVKEKITKLEREIRELKKSIKPILKEREEAIKEVDEDEKSNKAAIKSHLCKKCGGVIVRDIMTSCMRANYGKECFCKSKRRKKK